jgi:hypothetical protein
MPGGGKASSCCNLWRDAMGLFSDHFRLEYEGSVIEVETRSENIFFGTFWYSLIIDNRRVEDLKGSLGRFSLRGQLNRGGDKPGRPIAVRVHQGLFGTKAFLEVDQQSHRMPRV